MPARDVTELTGPGYGCWACWTVAVPVTCARDSFEHLVADSAMTPGSAGRYVSLCGRAMWAAALACPPGPRCPACVAVRTVDTARQRRRHRQRRPGVRAWLKPIRRRHPRAVGTTDGAPDAD